MNRAEILFLDIWRRQQVQEMKLAGVRRYAEAKGWNVRVLSEGRSRADRIPGLLARYRPVGCIVECSAGHEDLTPEIFGGLPSVYLDCPLSFHKGRSAVVRNDGEETTQAAFRELASNRPSAYAVVGFMERRAWSDLRIRTFRRLAAEADRPCQAFIGSGEPKNVRAKGLADWVAGLPPKCAVFAVNDTMAVEVIAACERAGRKIPTDMTLVGVDNLEDLCESSAPRISSVQVDFERAGYRAAALLDRMIAGRVRRPAHETFGPLMVVRRESTRGFGRREPRILAAVDLIRREACNGLRARDVAQALRGSRRLTELRFRETMGHSILDEIDSVRMDRVCQLLLDRDVPLRTVVDRSGYPSEAALRKAFLKRTGLPLLEWRRRNA